MFPVAPLVICVTFLSLSVVLLGKKSTPHPLRHSTFGTLKHHEDATLAPDSDGVLLSANHSSFASENGQYVLALGPKGDVVLSRHQAEVRPLWWTMTGDGHGEHKLVFETPQDRLRLAVKANRHDDVCDTIWHSDMEPACRQAEPTGKSQDGRLVLSNRGRLSIDKICDLYVPVHDQEEERSLAVIVTGLYRTNHVACKSQMAHLISSHPSFKKIDVFAYVLYEEDDIKRNRTTESITEALRECYGDSLRTLDVIARKDEDVNYPGGDEALLPPCGDKLKRLNNQLHTINSAAERWWAWSIAEGYTHNTVLRLRPDTEFRKRPEFWSLKDLRDDTLVLPHPAGEHYFYCAQMDGRVGIGT
jgi:hypothetical protein